MIDYEQIDDPISSIMAYPIFDMLAVDESRTDEKIRRGIFMTRNQFTHKDNWYNLFETENSIKFMSIESASKPAVYPFFYDFSEHIQA